MKKFINFIWVVLLISRCFCEFKVIYYKGVKVADGEILVKFCDELKEGEVKKIQMDENLDDVEKLMIRNWYKLKFKGDIHEKIEKMKKNPKVEFIEPNYILKVKSILYPK